MINGDGGYSNSPCAETYLKAQEANKTAHKVMSSAHEGVLLCDFVKHCSELLVKMFNASAVSFSLDKGKDGKYNTLFSPGDDFIFQRESVSGEKFPEEHKITFTIRNMENNKGQATLYFSKEPRFSPDDMKLYRDFFKMLGIAFSHRSSQEHLRERIKENNCIYRIVKLGMKNDMKLRDLLIRTVNIVHYGFLFPDDLSCRIVFDNEEFLSENYEKPQSILSSSIKTAKGGNGMIEVSYPERIAKKHLNLFLREEKELIKNIGRELSLLIEKKISDREKKILKEQLFHAERLSTVGELAAGVAHELNQPLSSILGFSQLIQKESDDLPEQVESDIRKIITSTLNARDIVKKLMLFSRRMPPEKKSVDFNERIKEGISLLEHRLASADISVSCSFDKSLPPVVLDPSQLNQVVVNLVVNAMQAMTGGGSLYVSTKNSGDRVILEIKDNGHGMSQDIVDKIFDPFFTTKDINEGTGLGLSVVYGIVESHKGDVSVKTDEGVGTKFTISFPSKIVE